MKIDFTGDEILELIDTVNDRIELLYELRETETEQRYKDMHDETIDGLIGIARKLGEDYWD